MENNELLRWWTTAHRTDRKKLKDSLKIPDPVLSNYLHGRRRPPLELARIFSTQTGIPLNKIPYRYVHIPFETAGTE
jgi:hypothetical protein